MPLAITCPSCRKTFHAKDDLAGKQVKCPGCATVLAIPSAVAAATPSRPASRPIESASAASAAAPDRPKRRKKKRRERDEETAPLFNFAGIDFTAVKLAFAIPLLILMGVGVFFLMSWIITPSGPQVRVVDVYMAVNGVRNTDIGERVLQPETVAYTIPGHRKIVVTRDHPQGAFLEIKVRIPNSTVDRMLPRTAGYATLSRGYIKLEGGGEAIEALFVQPKSTTGLPFQMGFNPPIQEKGDPPDLRSFLGPGKDEWSIWTHEGKVTDQGDLIVFEGKNGMRVKTQLGDERLDGLPPSNPIADLTNSKIGMGLGKTGLVAAPGLFIKVSWDEDSRAYMCATDVEQPNDLSRYWEVDCIFPRPKNGGKELTLRVFDKAHPITLP